jgi:hypothetical protein
MHTIIAQSGPGTHPDPDAAARQRADRLAKATTDQMESALAYLSMIDPEAFEIAFIAVTTGIGEIHEDEEDDEDDEATPCAAGAAAWPGSSSAAAALAALPWRRRHVRRPADLRPGPCRRGRLDLP